MFLEPSRLRYSGKVNSIQDLAGAVIRDLFMSMQRVCQASWNWFVDVCRACRVYPADMWYILGNSFFQQFLSALVSIICDLNMCGS